MSAAVPGSSIRCVPAVASGTGLTRPDIQQHTPYMLPPPLAAMRWAAPRGAARLVPAVPATARPFGKRTAPFAAGSLVMLFLAITQLHSQHATTRNREIPARFSLFRPGSGASGNGPETLPSVTAARWRRASDVLFVSPITTQLEQPATQPEGVARPSWSQLSQPQQRCPP